MWLPRQHTKIKFCSFCKLMSYTCFQFRTVAYELNVCVRNIIAVYVCVSATSVLQIHPLSFTHKHRRAHTPAHPRTHAHIREMMYQRLSAQKEQLNMTSGWTDGRTYREDTTIIMYSSEITKTGIC